VGLIGISSLLLSSRVLTIIAVVFGFLLLPALWLGVTTTVPTTVFVADMCQDLESYVQNHTNQNVMQYFNYYTKCEGVNPLLNLTLSANSSLLQAQEALQYAETHDIPNKQEVIERLEGVISELVHLIYTLDDLGNCTMVEDAYNDVRDTVCANMLNSLAANAVLLFLAGFFIFASLWGYIKFFLQLLAVNNPRSYSPINQNSSYIFRSLS